MKHLFKEWDKARESLINRPLYVFLDYDGTITPIAETPEKARISPKTKRLLKKISEKDNVKLGLISGRSLKDIKNKIGLKNVVYSGNHGLEIEGPKIKFKPLIHPGYRKAIVKIKQALAEKISSFRGAFIEDKGLSLSLHYRRVNKKDIPALKAVVREALILAAIKDKIRVKTGKMVIEIRPPVEWGKGKVVLWLLARERFALKNDAVFPVYLGDDASDEDAFRALRGKGLAIFVGAPKGSLAQYYLKDAKEVNRFLEMILRI